MKAPRGAKLIPLTQGQFAIVDAEDYERLKQWKWHAWRPKRTEPWRPVRTVSSKPKRVRKLYDEIMGPAPDGFEWDHRNRNPLDNRRSNLRAATRGQQTANSARRNKTGFRGVHAVKRRFSAHIKVNGVQRYLGLFVRAEDAALAYARAAKEVHGEFACLEVKRAAA